jgi:hypothetical protein
MKICYQRSSTMKRSYGILKTWLLFYPIEESIGNASDRKQIVTPVLAELMGNERCSGALTFAPRQLLPLLRILRTGVPDAQHVHNVAQALNGIPGFAWEQFDDPAVPPAVQGPRMV